MNEAVPHLTRWGVSLEELAKLVDDNPSLRGMLFGYVAEKKIDQFLKSEHITEVVKDDDHNRKKKGDRRIIYKGRSFTIEVKSLQTSQIKNKEDGSWRGRAQVDASDRRIITFPDGKKLNTTLLLRGEFDLLAVNCFSFGEQWKFCFAKNSDLPMSTHEKYPRKYREQLISSMVPVTWPPEPPYTTDIFAILEDLLAVPTRTSTEVTVEPVPKNATKVVRKTQKRSK